nr:MAG TPA: hypothetical protein [Caudoviricetes sp.]DAU26589.1 MAG TPA: hypothetical protein [Caudoviricetes sp.]
MSKKGGNLFRVGRMWRHYSTSKEGPQEESKILSKWRSILT